MAWQHSRLAHKNLCIYGYAFNVASVSLFCIRHAEPRDTLAAIRLGPHVFVGCLQQFLWRVLSGPLLAIKLIKRGWGLGTRLGYGRCCVVFLRSENTLIQPIIRAHRWQHPLVHNALQEQVGQLCCHQGAIFRSLGN